MILWYFFHKYFIQKKKHSLYAVCHCLTEKAMASPSEFGLAIEVTDGPKTLLKQKQTGLQKQKHTYFYLSFVCCMNVRCRVSMSSIFASTFASFMLKVKKKKKKKIPTDRPTLWKVISGQSNNLFFLALLWLSATHHISFLLTQFSGRYIFHLPILHFLP